MDKETFDKLKKYVETMNAAQLNAFSTGFVVFEKLQKSRDAKKFLEISQILEKKLEENA